MFWASQLPFHRKCALVACDKHLMTKLRFPMTDWKEPKFKENGGQELIDKSLDLCYLQLHRVLYGQA